jgi:hypothetical protein
LTIAAATMRGQTLLKRSKLCWIFVALLFTNGVIAQWDVCALFGDRALPFGTREFCTATGLTSKGGSDNNGCMILGVVEEALQGLSSGPFVCNAFRQLPAAAESLNGEQR